MMNAAAALLSLLIVSNLCEAKINYVNVVSEIQARFAITSVVSEVTNDGRRAAELSFRATLPDAAFISNFSL